MNNLQYDGLLTPKGIWNIEQNKPSLVVRDLAPYAPPEVVHRVLLARGIYKWLSVRRDLIRLKNVWKDRINNTLSNLRVAKSVHNDYEVGYLRGYLKAYEECRGEIRDLCHSDRWRAPDFDRGANQFLATLTPKLEDE